MQLNLDIHQEYDLGVNTIPRSARVLLAHHLATMLKLPHTQNSKATMTGISLCSPSLFPIYSVTDGTGTMHTYGPMDPS